VVLLVWKGVCVRGGRACRDKGGEECVCFVTCLSVSTGGERTIDGEILVQGEIPVQGVQIVRAARACERERAAGTSDYQRHGPSSLALSCQKRPTIVSKETY
jgi:hypothetical protein